MARGRKAYRIAQPNKQPSVENQPPHTGDANSSRSPTRGSDDGSYEEIFGNDILEQTASGIKKMMREKAPRKVDMPMREGDEKWEYSPLPNNLQVHYPAQAIIQQRIRREKYKKALELWIQLCEDQARKRYHAYQTERSAGTLPDLCKSGRGRNEEDGARPKEGTRVRLKWDITGQPVGYWGQKFNTLIGIYGRRGDIFNPWFNWKSQPYDSLGTTWVALNGMFVFDNPGHAWDYIFAKMPHHISEWRYDIRRENVLPYELEFDMFYHLNSHIDSIHFAGLLCYWETDGFKRYSESGKANWAKILLNPTQGSRGIAQIQHAHELQGEKRLPVTMVFEEIYREKKTKQTPETKEFKSKYLDTLYNTIEQETIQRSMSGSDSNSGPLFVEFEDHCVEVQQRIAPSKCKKRTRLLCGAFASKKPYKSSTETNIEHTGFVSAETLAQEIRQAREEMREEMR